MNQINLDKLKTELESVFDEAKEHPIIVSMPNDESRVIINHNTYINLIKMIHRIKIDSRDSINFNKH